MGGSAPGAPSTHLKTATQCLRGSSFCCKASTSTPSWSRSNGQQLQAGAAVHAATGMSRLQKHVGGGIAVGEGARGSGANTSPVPHEPGPERCLEPLGGLPD